MIVTYMLSLCAKSTLHMYFMKLKIFVNLYTSTVLTHDPLNPYCLHLHNLTCLFESPRMTTLSMYTPQDNDVKLLQHVGEVDSTFLARHPHNIGRELL